MRNLPLHLDQMEEVGLFQHDMSLYARIMAEALALLHWIGKVDGNDIEFVLAPQMRNSRVLTIYQTCLVSIARGCSILIYAEICQWTKMV